MKPFSVLPAAQMMNLFAFRDWETGKRKPDQTRKHALDLYSIVAMTTEEELATAEQLSQKYRRTPEAQEAGRIVREFFTDREEAEFQSLLSDLLP